MDFDLGSDSEALEDYTSVPAGTYLCRIEEVKPGTTRHGDDRWGIRLVVAEGEYSGRHAAWDGLVFSARGRARVRRIFGAFGLATSGRVSIEPQDLVGREAFVEVRPLEYDDPKTGVKVRRNEVPYDGYSAVPAERSGPVADDAVPF